MSNCGSGKSLAYAIAVLNRVDDKLNFTQAIVLVTSYEAAVQLTRLMTDLAISTRVKIGVAIKTTKSNRQYYILYYSQIVLIFLLYF